MYGMVNPCLQQQQQQAAGRGIVACPSIQIRCIYVVPAGITNMDPACMPNMDPACIPNMVPACITNVVPACITNVVPACIPIGLIKACNICY